MEGRATAKNKFANSRNRRESKVAGEAWLQINTSKQAGADGARPRPSACAGEFGLMNRVLGSHGRVLSQ